MGGETTWQLSGTERKHAGNADATQRIHERPVTQLREGPAHTWLDPQHGWRKTFICAGVPANIETNGRKKIVMHAADLESFGLGDNDKAKQLGTLPPRVKELKRSTG